MFLQDFALLLSFVALVAANPTLLTSRDPDWSYQVLYKYAISRGGPEDFTAALVHSHVTSHAGLEWNATYAGDITLPDGGVLVVRNTPHGRQLLAGRLSPTSIVAAELVESGVESPRPLNNTLPRDLQRRTTLNTCKYLYLTFGITF
jgi:hypothetical protein